MAPEPEANVAEIADKILGNRGDAVVYAAPSDFRKYGRVLRRIKILGEIKHEDVALPPVLAVMLCEEMRNTSDGEVVALARQARAVVVDERPGEHRR